MPLPAGARGQALLACFLTANTGKKVLTGWPPWAPSKHREHLGFLPSLEKALAFCNRIRIPAIPAKGSVLGTDATSVNMPLILVHRVQT